MVIVLLQMTPAERAAHVTYRLALGAELTAAQLADEYGISRQAAHDILNRTSRVVPLASSGGIWRVSDIWRGE